MHTFFLLVKVNPKNKELNFVIVYYFQNYKISRYSNLLFLYSHSVCMYVLCVFPMLGSSENFSACFIKFHIFFLLKDLYDPAEPTQDSLDDVVARQLGPLGESLLEKLQKHQEAFTLKISKHLAHVESKYNFGTEHPNFRSEANKKHYERKILVFFLS